MISSYARLKIITELLSSSPHFQTHFDPVFYIFYLDESREVWDACLPRVMGGDLAALTHVQKRGINISVYRKSLVSHKVMEMHGGRDEAAENGIKNKEYITIIHRSGSG